MEIVWADSQPFVAKIHAAEALLYDEEIGPVRFYGKDKKGRPTGVTIDKNMMMDELKKVYFDIVRPGVVNTGRPTVPLLKKTSD